MNFLNFLTSGANIFNFNLQALSQQPNANALLNMNDVSSKRFNALQNERTPEGSEATKMAQLLVKAKKEQSNSSTASPELLSEQQQLINQYMHLNLQLLSQKINNLEQNPEKRVQNEPSSQPQIKNSKKKIKKFNTNCQHSERQHYAKGMCNNCYHKNGRTKKPWKCTHDKLYANGLCQNCYINKYNRMKRENKPSIDGNQESNRIESQPQQENSAIRLPVQIILEVSREVKVEKNDEQIVSVVRINEQAQKEEQN